MESLAYYKMADKILQLNEEERMMLLYKIMESLNQDITKYIKDENDALIISPCVIIKTLMLSDDFKGLIKQLYSLEEASIIKNDLESTTSLILR